MNLKAVKSVVVHHSATPQGTTFESIRRGHLAKGWSDIGYHAVILSNGDLRTGRRLPLAGAHAPPRNFESIGLCIVGDNTRPDEIWTPDQLETAKQYLNALGLVFPGIEVIGHRDVQAGHTACPGLDRERLLYLLGRAP
jgi:hypothetical protein